MIPRASRLCSSTARLELSAFGSHSLTVGIILPLSFNDQLPPNPPQSFARQLASYRVTPKIVFEDRVNRPKAVLPINLLALGISPSAVGNPHFVNSAAPASEFRDDFRLNPKTIFFYLNRLDKRSLEGFVACFHVG